MVVWRRIKNGMSVILLLAFIFYIGYCTKELYTRVLNNRKYSRLIEYEKEVSWYSYLVLLALGLLFFLIIKFFIDNAIFLKRLVRDFWILKKINSLLGFKKQKLQS